MIEYSAVDKFIKAYDQMQNLTTYLVTKINEVITDTRDIKKSMIIKVSYDIIIWWRIYNSRNITVWRKYQINITG